MFLLTTFALLSFAPSFFLFYCSSVPVGLLPKPPLTNTSASPSQSQLCELFCYFVITFSLITWLKSETCSYEDVKKQNTAPCKLYMLWLDVKWLNEPFIMQLARVFEYKMHLQMNGFCNYLYISFNTTGVQCSKVLFYKAPRQFRLFHIWQKMHQNTQNNGKESAIETDKGIIDKTISCSTFAVYVQCLRLWRKIH